MYENPLPSIIVKGEKDYEVEAILRHKSKYVQHFYLVMWKGYLITKYND